MRRITIFADEDDAKKAVDWLEQEGFDFMSEAYAAPDLQRRPQPSRRAAPERHEAPGSFLQPTLRPSPRKKKKLSEMILVWVKEADCLTQAQLRSLAEDGGWKPHLVKDTVRRLVKAGKLEENILPTPHDYSLPQE